MKKYCDIIKIGAFCSTFLAVIVCIAYFIIIIRHISCEEIEPIIRQQMTKGFGDLFAGTVGVFLSFAATLFMFVTFREQRKQFQENKTDVKKDRFENTFFNLLSMLYQVRASADKEIYQRSKGKMQSIIDFYNNLKSTYSKNAETQEQKEINEYLQKRKPNKVEREKIEQYLSDFYYEYTQNIKFNIGYYYRYLFNIINFVIDQWENSPNSDETIHKYLNFIQAQMSNEELALIFYDAISPYGLDTNHYHKFKEEIDKYGFLENIGESTLLDRNHHIIYTNTLFKFLNRDEKAFKRSI